MSKKNLQPCWGDRFQIPRSTRRTNERHPAVGGLCWSGGCLSCSGRAPGVLVSQSATARLADPAAHARSRSGAGRAAGGAGSTACGTLSGQGSSGGLYTLLDEGVFLCSLSTMYRILAENCEVRERRNQL